jgi:hypothetical protein
MVTLKRSQIFVTRTDSGYCLVYDNPHFSFHGYLPVSPANSCSHEKAQYITFAQAVEAVASINLTSYRRGIAVKFDKKANIPPAEADALRKVVSRLETLAKQLSDYELKIEKAAQILTIK